LKTSFSIHSDGRELLVQGKIFEVVRDVCEVCSVPDIACEEPQYANQHLVEWINMATKCFPYPDGCKLFDAFWHTLVANRDGDGNQKSPQSFSEIFSLLFDESTGRHPSFPDQTYSSRQLRPSGKGKLELTNLQTRAPGKTYQEIRNALNASLRNRRLGTTIKRYLGLFPRQAQAGDVVCVLSGCHVPFVLRKDRGVTYKLVGECYVHGIMDGEVMKMEKIPLTTITIT
jgi:hypothetical protein